MQTRNWRIHHKKEKSAVEAVGGTPSERGDGGKKQEELRERENERELVLDD